VCLSVGHVRHQARTAAGFCAANPMSTTSNYIPAGKEADLSGSSSDDDDEGEAFDHDPVVLEDKELGFHSL